MEIESLALGLVKETRDAAVRAFSEAKVAVAVAKSTAALKGPAVPVSEEAFTVAQEAFDVAQEAWALARDCSVALQEVSRLARLEKENTGGLRGSAYRERVLDSSVPVNSRKLVWLCVAAVSLGFLTLAAYHGYTRFRAWQLDGMVTVAEQALTKRDYLQASLSARRALQIDRNYRPACEVMAQLSEQVGDAAAVSWRQRLAELSPDSLRARLDVAAAALRFDRVDAARAALEEVQGADRENPEFLAAAGALALAMSDRRSAERFYVQASRLAPNDTGHRYALARIRTESGDYFSREAGRQALLGLADDPKFGLEALRVLIVSYQATKEPLAALRASAKLVAAPGHVFTDKLLRLTLLVTTGASDWADELTAAQDEAAKHPKDAAALVFWMVDAGRAADALDWINRRTPEVGGLLEVRPALVASYVALGNWEAVLKATGSEWDLGEHMRHAYRSRALREQGQPRLAQTEWYVALTSAGRVPGAIRWLASLAWEWKWEEEEEQALLMAIETQAKAPWALQLLSKRYSAKGDTAALRRVAASLMEVDPRSDDARNDFAFLSLLLFEDMERAARLARDLHQENPNNAAYASTHALALHLYGRSEEALGVMKKLPPERLEEPSIAAYYAIMLVANHEPAKASRFLRLAESAHFLPEERRMIAEAANAVAMVAGSRVGTPGP